MGVWNCLMVAADLLQEMPHCSASLRYEHKRLALEVGLALPLRTPRDQLSPSGAKAPSFHPGRMSATRDAKGYGFRLSSTEVL